MIVTFTPNPSLDRTITVESLFRGEVNRASHVRVDPGGKGVNVTRALRANDVESRAVLPLGGPDGALLASLLTAADVDHAVVPIEDHTRTNVAVIEPDGTTTKINEPGPRLLPQDVARLREVLPSDAEWTVLCGSLPSGADPRVFADLVAEHRGRVAVDTSGVALRAAVDARPDLIKPNLEELEELVGRALPTLDDIRSACRELVGSGVPMVVASLGAAGALLTSTDGQWLASASVSRPRSTVGAGDCLLAGVVSGLVAGLPVQECLARGVAWGAAAVALPGSQVPGPADIAQVEVSLIPLNPIPEPKSKETLMSTRTATIASTVGLHARPAALFVQRVTESGVPVTIGKPGGKSVNAASMLAVMSLGAKYNEEVEVGCEDEQVLDDLVQFLETDHDAGH